MKLTPGAQNILQKLICDVLKCSHLFILSFEHVEATVAFQESILSKQSERVTPADSLFCLTLVRNSFAHFLSTHRGGRCKQSPLHSSKNVLLLQHMLFGPN